jgi:DNA-binding CsgD family transcriptional regulator
MSVARDLDALTDKEKATLRLIVRGHDAKSAARTLDLSVHTINERLREARRKLAVPSSREAARLLFEAEGGTPETVGDSEIGEAPGAGRSEDQRAPVVGANGARRRPWIIGAIVMSLSLALIALFGLNPPAAAPQAPAAATTADPAVLDTAQAFVALVDQDRWADSYKLTGKSFQKLNTEAVWARVSTQVRGQLGKATNRRFVAQENLPAPPYGYEMIRFRTDYTNKPGATEKVTLEREGEGWRVVGIVIE